MKWMSFLADASAAIVALVVGGAIVGMCVVVSMI